MKYKVILKRFNNEKSVLASFNNLTLAKIFAESESLKKHTREMFKAENNSIWIKLPPVEAFGSAGECLTEAYLDEYDRPHLKARLNGTEWELVHMGGHILYMKNGAQVKRTTGRHYWGFTATDFLEYIGA